MLDQPVVERPVVLELERAERMADVLDRIRLAMGEVVGRVDAPGVAGARVADVADAIEHRVAQVDVAGAHVDLGAQHPAALGKLAGAHAAQQIEVLVGRRSRYGLLRPGSVSVPRYVADLVGRQVVDIGVARAHQMLGPLVQLAEVVRGEARLLAPVEAEPAHVALDRVDVLVLLLDRVGVVEAQVAAAAEVLRDAEVEADRLGVADVQIAVGLRRKARDDGIVAAGRAVRAHDVADEVRSRPLQRRSWDPQGSKAASSCQKRRRPPSRTLSRRRAA